MTNTAAQLCLHLAPRDHPDSEWLGFHGQAKICVEVQCLARNALQMQPVEQRCQEHKHLQASKSVTQATALSHPKDHHLLRQILVQLPVLIEEPLWTKVIWIVPDFAGDTTINISQYASLTHIQSLLHTHKYILYRYNKTYHYYRDHLPVMIDLILVHKNTGVFGDEVSIESYIFSGAKFKTREQTQSR